jgi:tetratricopeptide (TPR) repeat protein
MIAATNEINPFESTYAGAIATILHLEMREYEQAEAVAVRALDLSEKNQIPQNIGFLRCLLGRARVKLGRPTEGIALIRQGMPVLAEVGSHIFDTYNAVALAEAQLAGAPVDGLDAVERALEANPVPVGRPEAFRLRGELRLKQGQKEPATADLREARALSRSMGAKVWELRATMSLARLLASEGRCDEARMILAEVYNWFTEGFDTPDLKEAKALLEELGGTEHGRVHE